MKKSFVAVLLASVWIVISEFVRNELLFKYFWVDTFNNLGLTFETLPINGLLWFVWSVLLAVLIHRLLRITSQKETIILSWLCAFMMMWITVYNLQVLPLGLLIFAVPLSLLEIFVAVIILKRFTP